ncbi:YfiT family bacillithiol transferase [Taibaiella soli]|uniref:Putative metal-dependent hydrolase n=1 Tax=Taibaiella soli TaxID=1649169 RepID=A0A2W2BB74_9BACT|nr:putative metal-dependent hydrolase [Taibaiella soli]PZF73147.1 putative metal-dependent hydrolase [Taibaiella soli]
MEENLSQLQYPIGIYTAPDNYDEKQLNFWISAIEALPKWLDYCIENLDEAQLKQPYRLGGWNSIQIIHHLADSHANAYIRLKLALTEENPVIKPYDQDLWAELQDIYRVPVNVSITLLHALHLRWVAVLKNLKEDDWKRSFFHLEQNKLVPIWEMTSQYAWHGRHHMEQIRQMRERNNW